MQGNFSHDGGGYLDKLKTYIESRFIQYDNLNLEKEVKEFCVAYYGIEATNYIFDIIILFKDAVKGYDLWLYDDNDHPIFNDSLEEKAKNILKKFSMLN